MGRIGRGLAVAVAAATAALPSAAAVEKPQRDVPSKAASRPAVMDAAALVAELGAVRQRTIAQVRAMQQRERVITRLEIGIAAMVQGVDATTAQLDETRKQQEALLAALERLAEAPPQALALSPKGPIERARSAVLIAAAVPALAAQARDLTGQLAAMQSVRVRIDTSRHDVDKALAALAEDRRTLAQLVARRGELIDRLLRDGGKSAGVEATADAAGDMFDLIKRADADNERRDQELAARLHPAVSPGKAGAAVDPTRPKELRAFDAPRAVIGLPAEGSITHRFGEADPSGRPSQGLTIAVLPGGVAVAPFDGRVDYAGSRGDDGLILIIRHGAGYHSLLVGLGRVDVKPGQWVLAGEPVGAVPDAPERGARPMLQFELRREGRPVDPESRLAGGDEKDNRVHQ